MNTSIPEKQEVTQDLGNNWLMCPICQEAWEDHFESGVIRCPKCKSKLQNPKFKPYWYANLESFRPQRYEIKYNPSAGFYLYVFEDGKCMQNHVQDTLEMAIEYAQKNYDVPKNAWKESMKINLDENFPVITILGEVCGGFRVDNFEKKIGVTEKVALSLLEKILEKERSGIIEIYLDDSDISIIQNAFKVVAKEIEEWEFQTRVGVDLSEAKEIPIFRESEL